MRVGVVCSGRQCARRAGTGAIYLFISIHFRFCVGLNENSFPFDVCSLLFHFSSDSARAGWP